MRTAISNPRRTDGLTTLEIVLATVIVLVLAAIALPNFVKARTTTSIHSCYFHQMWIESAKAKWAMENNKSPSHTPTEAELLAYMAKVAPMWDGRKCRRADVLAKLPTCFLNGAKYVVGAVGERVLCTETVVPHAWDEKAYRYHYALGQKR